jgi:hypothetical protein
MSTDIGSVPPRQPGTFGLGPGGIDGQEAAASYSSKELTDPEPLQKQADSACKDSDKTSYLNPLLPGKRLMHKVMVTSPRSTTGKAGPSPVTLPDLKLPGSETS